MLGKRTVAAIVALMLILGMGATTLLTLMPPPAAEYPSHSPGMTPVTGRAWTVPDREARLTRLT